MDLRQGRIWPGGKRVRSARKALCLDHGRRGTGKMREKMKILNMLFIRDVDNPGDDRPDMRGVNFPGQALARQVIK